MGVLDAFFDEEIKKDPSILASEPSTRSLSGVVSFASDLATTALPTSPQSQTQTTPGTSSQVLSDFFDQEIAKDPGLVNPVVAGVRDRIPPAIEQAADRNPEQFSNDLKLSEATGVAVDVVERNREEMKRRASVSGIDPVDLTKNYPATAVYFSDPFKASTSLDDLDNLKQIEDESKNRNTLLNLLSAVPDRSVQLSGDLLELVGNLGRDLSDYMQTKGIPDPGFVREADGSWKFYGDIPKGTPDLLVETGRRLSTESPFGYKPEFTFERMMKEPSPLNIAGAGVEAAISSIPDMIAAVYAFPLYVASTGESIAEKRALRNQNKYETAFGVPPDVHTSDIVKALPFAYGSAKFEQLASKFELKATGAKGATDIVKAVGLGGLVESVTETIQEMIQYIGESLGTDKGPGTKEAVSRAVQAFVIGGLAGGVTKGSVAGFDATMNLARRQSEVKIRSEIEQETFDKLTDLVAENKTAPRSRTHFQDFVNALEFDHEVLVPRETLDAAELKNPDLPPMPRPLADAMAVDDGSDVVAISMADYLHSIATNLDWLNVVRPVATLSLDTQAKGEGKTLDTEKERMKALVKASLDYQAQLSEASDLYEATRTALIETGRMTPAEARMNAILIPAYAATAAARRGITVKEVMDTMNLVISDTAPPGVLEDTGPPVPAKDQNFSGVTLPQERKVNVREAGKAAKIKPNAQKMWDIAQKRKNIAEELIRCLSR